MTNIRNNWKDLPDKTTPINAERLNNLEQNAGKGADFVDNVSAVGMDLVTAETALAARTFIGAGTSNLEIGTTATTAKAGNYAPTLAEIPSLPTSKINNGVFNIAQIPTGTTATTVALGNHTHANATTSTAGFMSNTDKANLDGLSNAFNSVVSGVITPISPWVDTANTQTLKKRNGVVQLIIQLNGGDPWSPNVIFVVPAGFKPMFNTVATAVTMESSGSVSILYDSTTNDFLVYGLGEKPADWTVNSKLIISMTYLCEV